MTIREVINILIDSPDKDKPFIIECKKDVLKNCDYEWGQLEIVNIVNCSHSSIAEARAESEIEEHKINVGDEIKSQSGTIAVVLHIDAWKRLCCIQTNGRAFFINENCYHTYWKKTGRHTDNVDKLLRDMKGDIRINDRN